MYTIRACDKQGGYDITVNPAEFVVGASVGKVDFDNTVEFALAYVTLLADSPLGQKPRRTVRAFSRTLCSDVRALVLSYAKLSHLLVCNLTIMGGGASRGEWLADFKDTPVFAEYYQFFHTGDIACLRYLYTFLNFGKKLKIRDAAFEEVAFRDWLAVEERLHDLILNPTDLYSLNAILTSTLPQLQSLTFWPTHGPGCVAEVGIRLTSRKHPFIAYDRKIDHVFFSGSLFSWGLREDQGFSTRKVLPDPASWTPDRPVKRRPSRLRFVPKNLKVARSICMEPTTMMFFQQGLCRMMIDGIDECAFARFIRLRDQTRNRDLAEYGSYTGRLDTLDLSSASDSVSVDLVRAIFPRSWLIPMLATRNSQTLTPSGLLQIKKFAPMGSAVCFPTQCLIFASVCIYAAHLYSHGLPFTASVPMSPNDVKHAIEAFSDTVMCATKLEPLAVYGDDIVCDFRLTGYVAAILERLGFSFNQDKSFTGVQSFRESCGGFYVEGHDITPLYYRVSGSPRQLTGERVYSQVHLINECWHRGFRKTRAFLLRSLKRFAKGVPFVVETSTEFGIISTPYMTWRGLDKIFDLSGFRQNHLRRRKNAKLMRLEYRVVAVKPEDSHRGDFRHEAFLLGSWMHASLHNREEGTTSQHWSSGGSRLGWRWTPLY
jgi:hypothetical protein